MDFRSSLVLLILLFPSLRVGASEVQSSCSDDAPTSSESEWTGGTYVSTDSSANISSSASPRGCAGECAFELPSWLSLRLEVMFSFAGERQVQRKINVLHEGSFFEHEYAGALQTSTATLGAGVGLHWRAMFVNWRWSRALSSAADRMRLLDARPSFQIDSVTTESYTLGVGAQIVLHPNVRVGAEFEAGFRANRIAFSSIIGDCVEEGFQTEVEAIIRPRAFIGVSRGLVTLELSAFADLGSRDFGGTAALVLRGVPERR